MKKYFNKKMLFLFLFLFVMIGLKIMEKELSNPNYPRIILLNRSLKIASDYFPLGTGFGTYGTYLSAKYYSPVYFDYYMSKIWGMSQDYHPFLLDSFWPAILGQFGILGLLFFLFIILIILEEIFKLKYVNMKIYFSVMTLFVYMLVASTSETAFFNYYAVCYFIIIGFILRTTKNIGRNRKIVFQKGG
jgi:hypothetical protein